MVEPERPGGLVRVGDAERERTVAALREHAASGRLDPEELDDRVEQALRARTRDDLAELTSDLPGEPAPARPVAPGPRRDVLRFRRNAGVFAVMSVFFVVLWALGGGGAFWPVWPILGWGIAVALQGVKLLTSGPDEPPAGRRPA